MRTVKKIVVPVDLLEVANIPAHIEWAQSFQKTFSAELHFIYVITVPNLFSASSESKHSMDSLSKDMHTNAKERMDKIMVEFGNEKTFSVIRDGSRADEVLKFVDEIGADLIIMGTKRRTRLDRILFGSVVEVVSKLAKVPVMSVNPELK